MASRARGGARGQSTALPSRSRAPSAAEVRSRYVRQLDDTIDKMIESFKNVILSAQIHDRATNARGEFLAQVSTANLAMASESLVRLISELKLALIVQDVGEASEDERSSMTALSADTRRALDDLCRLRDNIAANLSALERHYYASVPHVRAHQAANANLQPQPPQ
eukprot:IDg17061t1